MKRVNVALQFACNRVQYPNAPLGRSHAGDGQKPKHG